MQGSTIATKNVALCSTDVNSTNRWDLPRYGGEGGIRAHGRVSPTLAFEASSFNRSDTSPQRQTILSEDGEQGNDGDLVVSRECFLQGYFKFSGGFPNGRNAGTRLR